MGTEMKDLDAPLASETAVKFPSRAQETRDAFLDNANTRSMLIVVWNHAMQEFLRYVDDFENRQWCEEDSVNIRTHQRARVFYLTLAAVGIRRLRACVTSQELVKRGARGRGERGKFT